MTLMVQIRGNGFGCFFVVLMHDICRRQLRGPVLWIAHVSKANSVAEFQRKWTPYGQMRTKCVFQEAMNHL